MSGFRELLMEAPCINSARRATGHIVIIMRDLNGYNTLLSKTQSASQPF